MYSQKATAEDDCRHRFQDEQPLPAGEAEPAVQIEQTPETSEPRMLDSGMAAMNMPTMRER